MYFYKFRVDIKILNKNNIKNYKTFYKKVVYAKEER